MSHLTILTLISQNCLSFVPGLYLRIPSICIHTHPPLDDMNRNTGLTACPVCITGGEGGGRGGGEEGRRRKIVNLLPFREVRWGDD